MDLTLIGKSELANEENRPKENEPDFVGFDSFHDSLIWIKCRLAIRFVDRFILA